MSHYWTLVLLGFQAFEGNRRTFDVSIQGMRISSYALMIVVLGAPIAWTAEPVPEPVEPGHYSVQVMPEFDRTLADRIDKAMASIQGIDDVNVRADDSSIHFHVKDHSIVDRSQLEAALQAIMPDAAMTTPMPEHSLTPHPGL